MLDQSLSSYNSVACKIALQKYDDCCAVYAARSGVQTEAVGTVPSRDIDWNDLRYVLVLAQHQTMVAAAEALRVHQTTISRRILALEERLKTRLFDRIDGRFAPTSRGMIVVRRAQEMESVGQALDGDLTHNPAHGRAVVRLSVIQTFVTGFLDRHLAGFPEKYPHIQLELICENRNSVLEHREADIAVRYVRPVQGQSMVRKIGELGSAAYAHKALLGPGLDWRKDLPWIGFAQVADRWPEFRWIEANVPTERVAMTVNGGPAYSELVARGYGAGLLTCVEGDALPDLVRLSGEQPLIVRGIWLLVLPELRRNATVRQVIDWIAAVSKRDVHTLLGSARKPNPDPAFLQEELAGE
jgi:DNA-binding transcriptional LysR family regulator